MKEKSWEPKSYELKGHEKSVVIDALWAELERRKAAKRYYEDAVKELQEVYDKLNKEDGNERL